MNENKFTPRAEEALRLSQEAAGELGHGYVGTEHLLLDGACAEGWHISEEVVEGVLQHAVHPPHQAGHRREEIVKEVVAEEAAAEEILHHPLVVGSDLLGVAQLLSALAAKVLFGDLAIDVALINNGDFILATILAFHK